MEPDNTHHYTDERVLTWIDNRVEEFPELDRVMGSDVGCVEWVFEAENHTENAIITNSISIFCALKSMIEVKNFQK